MQAPQRAAWNDSAEPRRRSASGAACRQVLQGMRMGLACVTLAPLRVAVLAALGATGALMVFAGRSLNVAGQRHLAHEIGRDDEERLREVFNSTLALFVAMSVGILLLGVLIEPLVIQAVMLDIESEAREREWAMAGHPHGPSGIAEAHRGLTTPRSSLTPKSPIMRPGAR